MTTDSIWVTTVMSGVPTPGFELSWPKDDPARRAMRQAKEPDPKDLPLIIFEDRPDATLDDLPELFIGGGLFVISDRVAAPFRQFDMGRTYFAPVKVLLADEVTEVHADRGYVAMERRKTVDAVDIEKCRDLRAGIHSDPPSVWSMPIKPKDDDIAVRTDVLNGPPIWGSPKVVGGVFFRGDIVDALSAAGVAELWKFKRCRIVD